jgi:ATP-dependent Clp protease ATP-binding subunit ClpC
MQIVDLMISEVGKQLLGKGVTLEMTQAAKDFLAEKGFDPNFGARPLRRQIQEHVEDCLSEELLAGKFGPGDTVVIDVEEGKTVVKVKSPAEVV